MGLLGKPTILGNYPQEEICPSKLPEFRISISAVLRPAKQLKFADIPNGLGALAKVCLGSEVTGLVG